MFISIFGVPKYEEISGDQKHDKSLTLFSKAPRVVGVIMFGATISGANPQDFQATPCNP